MSLELSPGLSQVLFYFNFFFFSILFNISLKKLFIVESNCVFQMRIKHRRWYIYIYIYRAWCWWEGIDFNTGEMASGAETNLQKRHSWFFHRRWTSIWTLGWSPLHSTPTRVFTIQGTTTERQIKRKKDRVLFVIWSILVLF